MIRLVLCLLALGLLAGCGQKAALFLPDSAAVTPSGEISADEESVDEVPPGEESLDEVPGAEEIPEDLLTP